MTAIRRIGSISHSPSPSREGERARAASPGAPAEAKNAPRSGAGLGGTNQSFRPVAGFLAQYVDQHHAWPRSPLRKVSQRQRATRAYIVADMLQDLLAETRRPRPVDEDL